MNSTYEQLIEVRAYLKPDDEFMCLVANELHLELAQEVIQASVRAVGEYCLQTHWEIINGYRCDQFPFTDPAYQTFRLQWLDKLIEAHK